MRENRETPQVSAWQVQADRLEKAMSHNPNTHACGESDSAVVPTKGSNKGAVRPAEGMEERALAKKNHDQASTCRTPSRESVSQGLAGVRQARLTFVFKAGAVCTKVCPYGSVRGASGNRRPYRD